MKLVIADSQMFFSHMLSPQIADQNLPQYLNLGGFTVAPPFSMDSKKLLEEVKRTIRELLEHNPAIKMVRISADLENLKDGVVHIIAGLQSVPTDITKQVVEELYHLGVRVMSMGYPPFPNQLFGKGYGLTKRGRDYLRWLHEAGMILDLSHLPDRAAAHVVAAVNAIRTVEKPFPLFISHTGVWECYNHPRNLKISTLQRLIEMDGVIGIYNLSFGLCSRVEAESSGGIVAAFCAHLSTALSLGSSSGKDEAVCLGSDAPWCEMSQEAWKQGFDKMTANFGAGVSGGPYFPDFPFEFNQVDKAGAIRKVLKGYRYMEPVIDNFLGRAYLHFMQRSLPK